VTSKRAWVIAGAVLVVGALAIARVAILRGDSAPRGQRAGGGPAAGAAPVEIYVVSAAPLADRITAIGTIRSNEEVQIRSEVSGKVEKVAFREGAKVARGDVLIKINDSELRAQLARAQGRLAIAMEEADRQQRLHADSLTSARDYSNAANEAGIARAETDLIRAQLEKTEIRAPFDGVIGLRSVSEGSYVSPLTPIASLQDLTPVKIEFAVPERYAGRIRVGDRITFSVEGAPGTFQGTIYAREAAIDAVTRALRIRATNPNDDGALIPGAFANVEVVFAQREAITVPSFAIVPELKGHRVFLYHGGKAEARSVEIGTRSEDRVEVVSGIDVGDTLITSSLLQLKSGAAVTIAPAEQEKRP
jgi:membrane fusion protein (multidrug efflux system)